MFPKCGSRTHKSYFFILQVEWVKLSYSDILCKTVTVLWLHSERYTQWPSVKILRTPLWSSMLWHHVVLYVVSSVSEASFASIFTVTSTLKDVRNTFLQNFGNHLQDYAASQPRWPQSESLSTSELQISGWELHFFTFVDNRPWPNPKTTRSLPYHRPYTLNTVKRKDEKRRSA